MDIMTRHDEDADLQAAIDAGEATVEATWEELRDAYEEAMRQGIEELDAKEYDAWLAVIKDELPPPPAPPIDWSEIPY